MVRWPRTITHLAALVAASTLVTAQAPGGGGQRPPRDRGGQRAPAQPQGTGSISGIVMAADTGRPLRRARVLLSSAEVPGGRGAQTDDQGAFIFSGLAPGRYSLTASKSGFVNLSYGQRRPRQPGTPLQLADGQHITSVNVSLPRGSVIAGHISDETGEPLVNASVQVLRYDYAQGNRQLVPAGVGSTDDQGAFRIWGLNPGEYYLSATTRNFDLGARAGTVVNAMPAMAPMPPGPIGAMAGGFVTSGSAVEITGGQVFFSADTTAAPSALGGPAFEMEGYAPTYYPGVSSSFDAQPVRLGLSAEVANLNFSVLLVKTARVTGRAATTDGSAISTGTVTLAPDGITGRGAGLNHATRVLPDGSFAIPNVPPGRYVLRARSGGPDAPQFAMQAITVAEGMPALTVMLAPGGTLTGTVTFQALGSSTVPDASQIRVVAPTTDFSLAGPNPVARVDRDGGFTLTGVSAGAHWIRTQAGVRGWMLKSVNVDGQEMIDAPLDVRAGQTIDNVNLVFVDRLTEVNGMLTDQQKSPLTDYTVLAFPTDQSLWRPQSRHIMTARPDQNGKFQIRGLPAGDYYLTAIDPVEQGEWFEPAFLEPRRTGAARITLGDSDTRTQNFTLVPEP